MNNMKIDQKLVGLVRYIEHRITNPHKNRIYKILYIADKEHLSHYGRFISGDSYIAGEQCPIPKRLSFLFDNPKEYPYSNIDMFSESDFECLYLITEEHGNKTDKQLSDIVCDLVWEETSMNSEIPLEGIVRTLSNKDELLDYLEHEGHL